MDVGEQKAWRLEGLDLGRVTEEPGLAPSQVRQATLEGRGHLLGRGQTWQRATGRVFERATFRNGRNRRNQQQDKESRTSTRKGQCRSALEKEFKEWGVSQLRALREVRRRGRQRGSLHPALVKRYRRQRPWCRKLGRKQVERCVSN